MLGPRARQPNHFIPALTLAALLALLSLGGWAGAASAQERPKRTPVCESQPGRAGLDQYCEAIPGDRGPQNVRRPTEDDLRRAQRAPSGDDAVLAQLVAAENRDARAREAREPGGETPAAGSGRIVSTDDWFIWALIFAVVGTAAYGLWRRYHRDRSDADAVAS